MLQSPCTTRRFGSTAWLAGAALVWTATASLPAQNPAGKPDTSSAASRALTLVGSVRDANGAAVGAAAVALIGARDTTVTDDSGRFVLHGPRAGAYMLNVHRLGFAPERLAVSLSAEHASGIAVTVIRTVPVLPTVTTSAAERRGYRDVGLELRMRAGLGYFLTLDQILRKQATEFPELLEGIPGLEVIHVPGGWIVRSIRSGCVSYWVDGKPQPVYTPQVVSTGRPGQQLGPGTRVGVVLGPGDPSEVIDGHNVGAIEYYESQRPVGFGTDGCALVVVWTQTRLGLQGNPASTDNSAASNTPVIRGVVTLEGNAVCALPATTDTMDFPIYAILEGMPARPVAKKLWTSYTDSVLSVIDRWSMLPTNLKLSTFGAPFTTDADASGQHAKTAAGDVAPTISSVIVFTLDSSGALTSARVASSALSGAADTSMLAELQRAAAAHAFPRFPGGRSGSDSTRFDLLVSSIEPPVDTKTAMIGQLEVPVWPLAHEAHLDANFPAASLDRDAADGATVQMVVDSRGRALNGTVRVLAAPAHADRNSLDSAYRQRLAQQLDQLRFEPAQTGSCPVPQLVTQRVGVPVPNP